MNSENICMRLKDVKLLRAFILSPYINNLGAFTIQRNEMASLQ